MEATASDTSVLARMLSWFFRIVSLKTVPISEQHMIAIHNALFMMAGEFVSQGATTDQHGLNTAMAQALQRNVEGHLNTTLAQYTKDLPALFAEVCLHTNVFCTEEWKYTQSHLEGQEHQAKSKNMRPNGPSTRMLSLCS